MYLCKRLVFGMHLKGLCSGPCSLSSALLLLALFFVSCSNGPAQNGSASSSNSNEVLYVIENGLIDDLRHRSEFPVHYPNRAAR